VALVLASFLAVTTSVVWRRSLGSGQAQRLQALSTQRAALDAQHAQLEGDVRRAASLLGLARDAQRLGMKVPSDSQVIFLVRPRPQGR